MLSFAVQTTRKVKKWFGGERIREKKEELSTRDRPSIAWNDPGNKAAEQNLIINASCTGREKNFVN